MTKFRWTPERLDQIENAARRQLRVALSRRGTEYVVIARRVETQGSREVLVGWLPMTGEEMRFALDDLDAFQVIDS